MNRKPTSKFFFWVNGKPGTNPALISPQEGQQELYEVFRVEKGVALFLEEHLERLCLGAQKLNLQIKAPDQLLKEVKQFIDMHPANRGNIRLSFWFSADSLKTEGYVARFVKHHYPAPSLYKTGVICRLTHDERNLPTIKISNPILRRRNDFLIKREQVFETILVNQEGKITEGSRSNLFFIRQNRVYTAPESIVLGGIIRKKVIHACKQLGFHLEFSAIDAINELPLMEASIITGTSPRVLPINRIGNQTFNPVHPMIKALSHHVEKQVAQYIETDK